MNTTEMNGAPMNASNVATVVLNPNVSAAFTATAGVNNIRPKTRGTSCILVVENRNLGTEWAMEGVTGKLRDAGRRR